MKLSRPLFALIITLGLALTLSRAQAPATPAPAPTAPVSAAATEGRALVEKIKAKLQAGQKTEAALSAELAEFDALLAKYSAEKTNDVAEIAVMKAMLYVQVFEDTAKGLPLLKQIQADFPGTKIAQGVDRMISSLEARAQAKAAQAALLGKPAPALNFTWATREGLKSLADLKGKVVILDFWATWCGPCIRSFPQIAETAAHYQGCDVEIVGVTSLQGRVSNLESQTIDCQGDPAKELGLMPAFIKKHGMTWTTAISAEEVFNPAYGVTGIPHLVILAPDGTVRHTGLHPAMPHEEKAKLIDALLTEFKLKLPAKA